MEKIVKYHRAKPDSRIYVASEIIGTNNIFSSIDELRDYAEAPQLKTTDFVLVEDFSRVPTENQPII